jgi:hypothetical protein
MHKIRNGILIDDGIQNLITEFEGKRLQWFGQIKMMGKPMISRRALQLKFKGKSSWDDLEQGGLARRWNTSRKEKELARN